MEINKPDSDQKTIGDLASAVRGAVEDEKRKIKGIQDHITDALNAMNTFHNNCKDYDITLPNERETLQPLLEDEGNDGAHLTGEIAEELKEIENLQTDIDRGDSFLKFPRSIPLLFSHTFADHQKINETAYYVWMLMQVTLIAEADIKRLKASMKKIQTLLDANEDKL
ncbi:hypothetical protein GGI35DRAFT_474635 [Trichoderma velutinum]